MQIRFDDVFISLCSAYYTSLIFSCKQRYSVKGLVKLFSQPRGRRVTLFNSDKESNFPTPKRSNVVTITLERKHFSFSLGNDILNICGGLKLPQYWLIVFLREKER